MKYRCILTVLVIVLDSIINKLFYLYYSPLAGSLTAQTLNDSNTSFAFAKFVQEGGISSLLTGISVIILLFIWMNPISKAAKAMGN